MAHSTLHLHHPATNQQVSIPVGFSWTMLFWGFLLCAYRQDWLVSFWCLIATAFLGPLPNLILCWFYNRWSIKRLLQSGYQVSSIDSEFTADQLSQAIGATIPRVQLNG